MWCEGVLPLYFLFYFFLLLFHSPSLSFVNPLCNHPLLCPEVALAWNSSLLSLPEQSLISHGLHNQLLQGVTDSNMYRNQAGKRNSGESMNLSPTTQAPIHPQLQPLLLSWNPRLILSDSFFFQKKLEI